MPAYPDLDRLVEEATFFPGLNVRLAALRELERTSEEQLALGRRLAVERVRLEHAQLGTNLHPEDRTFDLESLEQRVTLLLPSLIRGGLLLGAWSIFERSVKDIAFRAAVHAGASLSRSHFRSGNLLDSLEKALATAVRTPAFPDQSQKRSLQLLAAFRNLLIHHDGRLEEAGALLAGLKPSERDALGLQVERDYDFEYLVPRAAFVSDSVSVIYSYVHDLASRVFNELSPPKLPSE